MANEVYQEILAAIQSRDWDAFRGASVRLSVMVTTAQQRSAFDELRAADNFEAASRAIVGVYEAFVRGTTSPDGEPPG